MGKHISINKYMFIQLYYLNQIIYKNGVVWKMVGEQIALPWPAPTLCDHFLFALSQPTFSHKIYEGIQVGYKQYLE